MSDRYNVTDIVPAFDIRCEMKVLMVEMRDGVKLHTNIYLPPDFSGKAPVLLFRSPYTRTTWFELPSADCVKHQAVYVVQATRGTGWSEGGIFDPSDPEQEIRDAEDTLDFLEKQDFFNGSCVMMGASYPGWVQWAAAFSGHRALVGIAPQVAPFYGCISSVRPGGGNAFNFATHWIFSMHHRRKYGYAGVPDFDAMKVDWHLPANQCHEFAGYPESKAFGNFIAGAAEPAKVLDLSVKKFANIKAPAFIAGGWFDGFREETVKSFQLTKTQGATESVRKFTRLVIGPWAHPGLVNPDIFGRENDTRVLTELREKFLFNLLADRESDPLPGVPQVKYFMLGENQWHESCDWPPPEMRYTERFLHADGTISAEVPGEKEGVRSYISDPADPVRSSNGRSDCGGCFDLTDTEKRPDVLTYTSGVLTEDLRIAGKVKLRFSAAVNAPDTDFFATLTEVDDAGHSMLRTGGMIRARFRKGLDREELLIPGEVCVYEVSLGNTAANFRKGCRMRIIIAGQSFPEFDRNAQSGKAIFSDHEVFAAECTIFHDAAHPMVLTLPKIN